MELYSELSLISDYKEETYDWMSSDDIDVDDYEYVQNLASGVASQSRYFWTYAPPWGLFFNL